MVGVVDVEGDDVDLASVDFFVPRVAVEGGMHAGEDEALPAGRDDGQRFALRGRSVGQGSQICDYDIAAFPGSASIAHHAVAILMKVLLGDSSAIAAQFAAGKSRSHIAAAQLAAFSIATPRLQFVEPCDRGVQVCLVKGFAAAGRRAFDRENFDRRGYDIFEALFREVAFRVWVSARLL